MAMVDLFDDGGEFPAQLLGEPHAEDLADAIGGHAPQADFATALEDFVDGEVTLEDEIAAVLDLGDGIETREAHLAAFFFGKLRPQDQGPVVEVLADDLGTQPIGGGLETRHVIHCQESIVILVKADPGLVSSRSMKEWPLSQ